MALKHFITFGMCLLLGACAFKKDDGQEKEKAQTTTEALDQFQQNLDQKKQSETAGGQLTDQNVVVDFIELPEPGSYKMRITWPVSVVTMSVQIDEEFETTNVRGNVYERAVVENTTYRIHLASKNSDGLEVSRKQLKKTAPKDQLIKKDQSLTEDTIIDANRVYFYPNARIFTNGYNLTINANKIQVIRNENAPSSGIFWSEANIITSIMGQVAKKEVQLEGSKVSITAKSATGNLHVALIGLNGIDGRSGDELDAANNIQRLANPSLNGSDGKSGKLKSVNTPCLKSRGVDGPACEGPQLRCELAPENGQDGKPGAAGTNGENGSKGGSSGSLFIHIADSKDFSVEVGQRAGSPGRGGNGGAGSPGGLGGKAGVNPGAPCPNAIPGKPGDTGTTGNQGALGKDGTLGTIEANVVKTKIFAL